MFITTFMNLFYLSSISVSVVLFINFLLRLVKFHHQQVVDQFSGSSWNPDIQGPSCQICNISSVSSIGSTCTFYRKKSGVFVQDLQIRV